MEGGPFSDASVAEAISKNFIAVSLNIERPAALKVWQDHDTPPLSMALIFTPEGEAFGGLFPESPPTAEGYKGQVLRTVDQLKKFDELKKKLAEAPEDAKLRRSLGDLLLSVGSVERGEAELNKVIEQTADPAARLEMLEAIAAARWKHLPDGAVMRKLADRIEAADPENKHGRRDNALYWRGVADVMDARYVRSLERFQELDEKYPDSDRLADALPYIAEFLFKFKNDAKGAEKVARRYLKKYPDHTDYGYVEHLLKHLTGEHGDH